MAEQPVAIPMSVDDARPRRTDAADSIVVDFGELFRSQRPRMLRLARLLLGSDGPAEDVVHDAFVNVYRRYDRIDNPVSYLRTSVVNGCRGEQRKLAIRRRFSTRLAPRESAGPHEYLLDALDALPPRQRVAIVLRYYEDLSDRDIANIVGGSPSAVNSLLQHGLAKLRKVIDP